ncbi:MAG: carboxypeptidase regulatory-like domain-containing protein, partial [Acidobacteriota bacterium]
MKRTLNTLLLSLFILSLLPYGAAQAAGRLGKDSDAVSRPRPAKTKSKKSRTAKSGETLESQQSGEAIRATEGDRDKKTGAPSDTPAGGSRKPVKIGPPVERRLTRAARKVFDLRSLPSTRPVPRERPEHEGPEVEPVMAEPLGPNAQPLPDTDFLRAPVVMAAAPAPNIVFEGLDRENWGAGSPPDTNGDVGPTYYIQSVNTSVGVYRKSDGFREAAFTFDTLMSQGAFGNQCDNHNFGDPVVLYDSFEDRWILTDFAFTLDGTGAVVPAEAFQCFAVSMTGNPVSGGWNFYSIKLTDGLNDYPKLAIWPDGVYMSANMFGYAAAASFQVARVWSFNKAQMYAGSPTVQVVSFDVGGGDFTVVPSNARLQTGTPPPGRPNLFMSSGTFLNALSIYKFHSDWNSISLSTFTGPDVAIAATSWPNANVAAIPQSGTAQTLDNLSFRAMVQNQYTNIGGVESLWLPHTVRRGDTTGFAAPRWYQVLVTGGTVNLTLPQASTFDPDAANVMHRWMPSLALDRAGNMALGYSTSSSTTFPSIKYAGRLATDPVNTMSLTEQVMFLGTGSQTSSTRWGDYSSMTLDPDGCTFWYTTEYANPLDQTFNHRWLTKIGSFKYTQCTTVGAGGTLSGTVTATVGGTPISGAAVQLGARSTTTNGSGFYSFLNLPAGTYPSMTASKPGFITGSASSIVVTDGGTTTQDFSLAAAPVNACLTDTTQADFQTGVPTSVSLTASPGDVQLAHPLTIDQQNTSLIASGFAFTTGWHGQTFTAGVTAPVVRVDLNLFSLNCSAVTMPNITLSIRNATGNVPSGADLGSATIAGFCNGAGGYFTANFGTPVNITAGTQYSLVWRTTLTGAASSPNPRYVSTVSSANPYANGRRATSPDGTTWTGAAGTANNDFGFIVYVDNGFSPAGNLVSSAKDSNPAPGLTPIWSNLSWTSVTPANTSLNFQVAASNAVAGPFAFVGPDGTAGTFFTSSPASLTQFYNKRFLQYKAYLATTNVAATPAVNDVTVCFNDVDCSGATAPITPAPLQVCPNSVGNSASGPAGATSYSWSISNGSIQGSTTSQSISYTAGAAGSVGLTLSITTASGCQVSNNVSVPIVVPATPTVTPSGPTSFCSGGSVTLTSSSATGNQWYDGLSLLVGETNQTYVATTNGNYNVVVTESGCPSAPSTSTAVTVTPTPATPTITPGGPTTFCAGGSVTLTSSSASGNQWYDGLTLLVGETNQTYVATANGSYNVVVTASGCSSAPSASTSVTVNPAPATPTITPSGPTSFCTGGSVTLTSSSGSGNQWYDGLTLLVGETNQTYVATANGSYNVVVTASGCSSAPSASTSVTVNPAPATPTITPGGPT